MRALSPRLPFRIQISGHYQNNGQIAYLASQGFTAFRIGGHAGIRDMSN
ncbi:hypothetical protein Metal_1943 [Methylomicrobium album BG8]|uniref:Uncharacterized protein n=1 Tax=Methylomicrobium album BG8 TaxID=686340 RepID=H8GPT0_METAL|nr:hypothetical protein Metal_1943 [Methylomicrobium album BG8]